MPGGGGGGLRWGTALRLRFVAVVRLFLALGLAVGCEGRCCAVVYERLVLVSKVSAVLGEALLSAVLEVEGGGLVGSVVTLLSGVCTSGVVFNVGVVAAGGGGGARLDLVSRRCFRGE